MKKTTYYLLIALMVLALASLACGSSNTGQKIGDAAAAPTSAPVQVQTYKAGEIIQVGDITIVLNTASLAGGKLSANFTIENKGSKDVAISSLMSFDAKDSDGVKMQIEIGCSAGGSSMDGTILPGDKLKGDICWTGATTGSVKIYFKNDIFGSGATVWQIP